MAEGLTLIIQNLVPTQVWATGTSDLLIAGTLRNAGSKPLPAGAAVVRFFTLSGLDYVSGDTSPRLPALAPGQSVTYTWRVRPTAPDARLSVALSLEEPNTPPQVRMIAIPHLLASPPEDTAPAGNAGNVRVAGLDALLQNDRMRLRLVGGNLAMLSCRTPGGWRTVGAIYPLVQCVSAEAGELPWCEGFQPSSVEAITEKDLVGVLIRGSIGTKWRASLKLVARNGSAGIEEYLWLTAQKSLQLWRVRFSPLHVGAGSFGSAASEALPCSVSGPNFVSACRWGEITCGIVTQGLPPIRGWQSITLDPAPGADYRTMGNEWSAPGEPAMIPRGGVIEMRAKLFALHPSLSVQDAMKVSLPAAALTAQHHQPAPAQTAAGAIRHRE
ncbi:MAG: hypothetical protein ACP5VE_14110 [Chthonomonadales bacterium]